MGILGLAAASLNVHNGPVAQLWQERPVEARKVKSSNLFGTTNNV